MGHLSRTGKRSRLVKVPNSACVQPRGLDAAHTSHFAAESMYRCIWEVDPLSFSADSVDTPPARFRQGTCCDGSPRKVCCPRNQILQKNCGPSTPMTGRSASSTAPMAPQTFSPTKISMQYSLHHGKFTTTPIALA